MYKSESFAQDDDKLTKIIDELKQLAGVQDTGHWTRWRKRRSKASGGRNSGQGNEQGRKGAGNF